MSFDAPINGDTDLTLADVIPAEVQAPDDVTVNEEFVGRIAAGMERLSSKHREVLVLRKSIRRWQKKAGGLENMMKSRSCIKNPTLLN